MGLLIDHVKQGYERTNDGNTARKFFLYFEESAEITGLNKDLVYNFALVLRILSCGSKIKIEEFNKLLTDTRNLYLELYNWYYMPSSVHKVLFHGCDVIKYFDIPIGLLSEEALEATHKKFVSFKFHLNSLDRITIFSGVKNISQYGLVDKYNGKSHLSHWVTEACNRMHGSDGSIFPPHIEKSRWLYIYDKDLCRLMPLVFEREVKTKSDIVGFRFTPPESVFGDVEHNPENLCFCPAGPPSCSPKGLFNVSLCQYDSPIMLSFPHFYLADDSLRTAVEGITPPEKDKHQFFLDVQPDMGATLRARARVQINLAVTQVYDIKQVANFPDIVFPIIWFEEGIDFLPDEITNLMKFAVSVPPRLRIVLLTGFLAIGAFLFLLAVLCLIRQSHRQSTLHLEGSNYLATAEIDIAKKNVKETRY